MFLQMFLFFRGFQPGCSYKLFSYKKKKGVALTSRFLAVLNHYAVWRVPGDDNKLRDKDTAFELEFEDDATFDVVE